MIIDVNASIGHYPFRRLVGNTAESMMRLMAQYGIDRAIVSSIHAVFYRDVHQGNAELIDTIRPYAENLYPVATINPTYVGWHRDLDDAIHKWKMKAVALYPSFHRYGLMDPIGIDAARRIAERDVPIVLTQRIEDRRQRHHWDIAEDLEMKSVLELAERVPSLRIYFCNWIGLDGAKLAAAGLKGRCLIDFARLHVLLHQDVPKLIDTLGIDSIAFGSHMPFDYLGGSLVKLANLEGLPEEDFEKVAWKNAQGFFRLG